MGWQKPVGGVKREVFPPPPHLMTLINWDGQMLYVFQIYLKNVNSGYLGREIFDLPPSFLKKPDQCYTVISMCGCTYVYIFVSAT